MGRVLAILTGALAGAAAGYWLGAFVACALLFPGNNLCGLIGVFITAPVGLVAGATAGWAIRRSHPHRSADPPA